jgi:hypothetical protein
MPEPSSIGIKAELPLPTKLIRTPVPTFFNSLLMGYCLGYGLDGHWFNLLLASRSAQGLFCSIV